jgi:hypothetical protein
MKRFGEIIVGSEFKPLILSPVASRAVFPARPVEISGELLRRPVRPLQILVPEGSFHQFIRRQLVVKHLPGGCYSGDGKFSWVQQALNR